MAWGKHKFCFMNDLNVYPFGKYKGTPKVMYYAENLFHFKTHRQFVF